MLKKLFKYLGAVLGVLTCLPLFVAPFALVSSSTLTSKTSSQAFALFEDLSGVKDLYSLADKTFGSFWVTLFQIAVIVALVLAVFLLVVMLLNDLKVAKAEKVEKLLATLLLVVGIVALVSIALLSFTNVIKTQGLGQTATTKFVGSSIGWLMPLLVIGIEIHAMLGASNAKKSKKRK